jgi:hypothetical protein
LGNLNFLAPDFIYAEFGNIMWKKQAFQNFDPADAADIEAGQRRWPNLSKYCLAGELGLITEAVIFILGES